MKFIHTADWHVGSSRTIPGYLERQIQGAKSVFLKAKELGIRTILICGDLVEKDLRPDERDALLKLILWSDDAGYNQLIVGGNHDQLAKGYSNLRFLETLYKKNRFRNTYVAVEKPKIITIKEQEFLLFPGFYEGKDINKGLRKWVGRCNKPPVVLMHEVVKGSIADNGFQLKHGVKIDSRLKVLYYACGDLHKFQRLTGLKNGFYCGSPVQHDFGEELPKGFLLVDTENPKNPEFIELEQKHPLITVKKAEDIVTTSKGSWVRVKADHLIDGDDLPDRVLKVEYDRPKGKDKKRANEREDVEIDKINPMDGLKIFLRKKVGLKGKLLKSATRKAEYYMEKL